MIEARYTQWQPPWAKLNQIKNTLQSNDSRGLVKAFVARGLAGHQLTHLFSSPYIHDRRCLFPLCILRTRTSPRHALFRR